MTSRNFADPQAAMLRLSGQNVSVLADPLVALDAIDVLVTRVRFAPQTPNGISLALMARKASVEAVGNLLT
jgi:hypothetical protein